jgi:homoserine O-acetyltransferase
MLNAERVVAASVLGAVLSPFAALAQPAPARVDPAAHHEFVIASFRTENGVTLPQARVVYGTYAPMAPAECQTNF